MNEYEFRVTIKTNKHAAKEEFKNLLTKIADRAEYDHAIQINLEEIETDSVETEFQTGGEIKGP